MLVAAAVCPHPPLLLPEVARGAAAEMATLRAACLAAVRSLPALEPELLVVIGGAPQPLPVGAGDWGSFSAYGVPRTVALSGRPNGPARLPLSLSVGAWLLETVGWRGEVTGVGVPDELSAQEADQLGRELARQADRVALLVMGDGSARRDARAPGYADQRAGDFDTRVAAALATADHTALRSLDPMLSRDLLVAGRASWQVLAGAAAGHKWTTDLGYDAAPYGVGYFVATWHRG